jgi:outer membrane protein assembly factor BamD
MFTLSASARRTSVLLLFCLAAFVRVARADLVWDPHHGWKIEGGVMSGLMGSEGRTALHMMNEARRDEDEFQNHAALKLYAKVIKKYPTSIYAPEAYYRTANIRLARHQYTKAFDAFQFIIARYPNVKRFNEIIDEEYRIASALLDGTRNLLFGMVPGLTNREKAVLYFEYIVQNAPYSDYAPLALMNSARGHQYLGQPEEAIDALDRMINSYPQSVLAPEAYLRLSQLHASLVEGPYYDQAETKQAITYDEDFMILFPSDPKIGQAAQGVDNMKKMLALSKIKIGDFFFFKRDNYPAARVFYNEAITSYPDSDVARQARQRLADVDAKAKGIVAPRVEKKKHFLIF